MPTRPRWPRWRSGARGQQPQGDQRPDDVLERAERIRTQQRNTKNKLYALHAPEVECISKGKARNPYEFGVKVSLAVTHKQGLMLERAASLATRTTAMSSAPA